MKLTASEKQVLNFLIYPETFERLLKESDMKSGPLRDDLMNLVSRGYVEVFEKSGNRSVSPFYDTDNLHQFSFKATKSGLGVIRRRDG